VIRAWAIGVISLALICVEAQPQELDSALQFLAPLLDQTWVGHYVDSPEDAHLQHVVRWQAILGGKAVKKVKAVAAVDFCEVSLYYWDAEVSQVSFMSLTNRGQQTHGTVRLDDGRIVMNGDRPDGRPFVLSFEILADGRLRDKFFNVIEGDLQQGHLIEYTPESGEEYEEALRCEYEQ
jgi:hypothetical protein